jgi:hypothetical protein
MGHSEAVTGPAKLVVDFETDFHKHICTTYSKLLSSIYGEWHLPVLREKLIQKPRRK